MTIYLILFLMAAMSAAGVVLAERGFKGREVPAGLWFGLLAIVANTASVLSVEEFNIALSLRDAPVVVAALFFGPLAGIIAGGIAAVERALTPLWGVGAATWCPMSTFLVALIASAIRKWYLDGRRPYLVQAVMLGVIFESLHLAMDLLMGLDRLSRCCEIVFSAFLPEAFGISAALAMACIILRCSGDIRVLWRSRATRMLEVYLVCCGIAISIIMVCSETKSRQDAAAAGRRTDNLFEALMMYTLHQDTIWYSDKLLEFDSITSDAARKLLENSGYDEMHIVDADGRVVQSADPACIGFDFRQHEETLKYLKLLEDKDSFVCEGFRTSVGQPDGPLVRYAAVSFPDRKGFLQLGFHKHRFEDDFKRMFFPLFDDFMQFFESDYTVIASTNDWIVAVANGGHSDAIGKTVQEIGMRVGRHHSRLFGEWCHVMERQIGEWRVFCVVPLVESYGESMIISAVLLLLFFAMVFGFRLVMLRLRRQQKKIDVLRAQADEKRRQDLEMSAKIQLSCLPSDLPSDGMFVFSARMRPAREVGGDFYDCYRYRDGRLVFTVADVSGKGVPAAMFMIKSKSVLKSSMHRCADIAAAVAEANVRLEHHNDAGMFVTVWTGVYDPSSGVVDFVNAGHNPPLIRRADGSVEWVRFRSGMALGVFPGGSYSVGRLQLHPGDSLLLYTDGITEAQDQAGAFYGETRLESLLSSSTRDLVGGVFDDVDRFSGAAEQADDMTVLELDTKL